jgi:hypothetical protein
MGLVLVIGGVVAMWVGWFVQPFGPIGLVAAATALAGCVFLRRRVLGSVLLGVGVASGLVFQALTFGLFDEGARPGRLGWTVLWSSAAVAAVGIIGGVILLIRPWRKQNSRQTDPLTPGPQQPPSVR